MNERCAISLFKRFRNAQDGQALVVTGLAIVVLMLVAGLGVDVSYLLYQRNQMQKAADAAAIAGAVTRVYGGNYVTAGRNDSTANGFTHGSNGITVTINNPPQSGPFNGDNNYVEAIVAQPQPAFFMRVGGFNTVNVAARAVASAAGNANGCIYVMDPSDFDTFTATGTTTASSACGIFVNSNNAAAFKDNGGACTITSGVTIVGNVDVDACSTPAQSAFKTGVAPLSDPLSYLANPTCPGCQHFNNIHLNKNGTLSPGIYDGGIQINAGISVTLNPGLYVLCGGGLKMSGGSISGTGVMFYNTDGSNAMCHNNAPAYGSIDVEGVTNSTLIASNTNTNNTYAGVLFFDDRQAATYANNPKNIFTGNASDNFTGAFYFPASSLQYSGGNSQAAYTIVVAWQFTINGNAIFNDDYSSLPGGGLIHTAVMAE